MKRRHLLGAPLGALASHALALDFASPPPPARVRASVDRIVNITVCLRPFRPQGPRIEAERLCGKHVVHHYGHGGSGWSLSWGSALAALPLIQAGRAKRIAVIGCGAIGLTTARIAQMAGLKVRIYTKERPPWVFSSSATGAWSPESRIATAAHATPAFAEQWERMARTSFRHHQSLLGLGLAEWRDGFVVSDTPFNQPLPAHQGEPEYAHLVDRLDDITPDGHPLTPDQHPFRVAHARRITQLTFNIRHYQRQLVEDFERAGGEIVMQEFRSPREWARLPEPVVVNCTGFGARQLVGDDSLVPVRGQMARLIPQPEVDYLLYYRGQNVAMVPRRDGIMVQAQADSDFGNDNLVPDRALTEAAVQRLAGLF